MTQPGSWGISDAEEGMKQELSAGMSQPLRVLPRLSWISDFAWVQRQGLDTYQIKIFFSVYLRGG